MMGFSTGNERHFCMKPLLILLIYFYTYQANAMPELCRKFLGLFASSKQTIQKIDPLEIYPVGHNSSQALTTEELALLAERDLTKTHKAASEIRGPLWRRLIENDRGAFKKLFRKKNNDSMWLAQFQEDWFPILEDKAFPFGYKLWLINLLYFEKPNHESLKKAEVFSSVFTVEEQKKAVAFWKQNNEPLGSYHFKYLINNPEARPQNFVERDIGRLVWFMEMECEWWKSEDFQNLALHYFEYRATRNLSDDHEQISRDHYLHNLVSGLSELEKSDPVKVGSFMQQFLTYVKPNYKHSSIDAWVIMQRPEYFQDPFYKYIEPLITQLAVKAKIDKKDLTKLKWEREEIFKHEQSRGEISQAQLDILLKRVQKVFGLFL
jgi:hypothetical protein